MDRRKYYQDQLVDEDDLNAGETNTYDAVGNLMSDIGIFGIISGGAITEQGVPSMSVDMSTPFIGYDQDGERIYKATGDVIDCSVDYLGNPTVPATPGESVWISIHGRFDYTLEDPKVIKGVTQYLTWKESYEWRVVAGTPAVSPGHAKPAPPADALLITDIELVNAQVSILTANIDESRKDTFVFTNAAGITVAAGAWTKLDAAAVTVQDALDSADNELISRDGAGEVDQDILPVSGAHKLGQAGSVWDEVHSSTVKIYTELLASVNGKIIGSAAARFVGWFNTLTVYTEILANATGVNLGSATARFDAWLEDVLIYSTLKAGSNGIVMGDSTNRFVHHMNSITHYGVLAGTHVFSAAKSVTVMIPVWDHESLGGTDWKPNSTAVDIETSVGAKVVHIRFNLPDGVTMTSMRIRWAQSAAGDMAAQIESVDEDNAATNVGASKTPTIFNGTTNWDTIASGLAESAARASKYHRVKVTSGAGTNKVYMLEVTLDVTDILKAALKNCS